jgi:hypothetical protein
MIRPMIQFCAAALLACLCFSTAPLRADTLDDVYYITQRTMQPVKPAPGKPLGPSERLSFILHRCDSLGKNVKDIYTTHLEIRGVSVSADGSQIVCQETRQPPGAEESNIVVLKSDGTLISTINVTKLGVRVFGAPVFLPDGTHLGLTIINLPGATPSAPQQPGKRTQSDLAAREWNEGQIVAQPFVASIDLDGQNLKRLGPGLAPSWSPDGQTIVYTDFTFSDEARQTVPPRARLFAMTADGKNPHPIAPENSAAGSFSSDGKSIVYVANLGQPTCDLFIADPTGASPRRISADPGKYFWPRFLTGSTTQFEVVCTLNAENGRVGSMQRVSGKTIYCLSTDGSPAIRIAPNDQRQLKCSLNLDVESFVFSLARPAKGTGTHQPLEPPLTSAAPYQPPGAERMPNLPTGPDIGPNATVQSVPTGKTVVFNGVHVYFRDDADGTTSVPPDGVYQLPSGRIIRVLGGKLQG